MFFRYDNLNFRYEPFPIGCARPLMEDGTYRTLVDNFPPLDLFESFRAMGKEGEKFTLSEKENPRTYGSFVQSSHVWREFHSWIKSDEFVYGLLDALSEHDIDLGYRQSSPLRQLYRRLKNRVRGKPLGRSHIPLRARFEFSALPVDGGHLVPHTDAPTKVVTIIVSMLREDEWNPAFGGGTDVNRPRNQRFSFNYVNRLASFADMDVVDTFDFAPNQAVIFVKTFNSWHSVRPMTGQGSPGMRKTLTINIEPRA